MKHFDISSNCLFFKPKYNNDFFPSFINYGINYQ